jgi:hypothetical protein
VQLGVCVRSLPASASALSVDVALALCAAHPLHAGYGQYTFGCNSISVSSWFHLTVTMSPDTTTLSFYLNGAPIGTPRQDQLINWGVYDTFRSEARAYAHARRCARR